MKRWHFDLIIIAFLLSITFNYYWLTTESLCEDRVYHCQQKFERCRNETDYILGIRGK